MHTAVAGPSPLLMLTRPTTSLTALLPLLCAVPCVTLSAQARADGAPLSVTVGWQPASVVEGTVFVVTIAGSAPGVLSATGRFAGQPLHFAAAGNGALMALAAAPLDSAGSRLLRVELELEGGARDVRTLTVPVATGRYTMQRLTVAPEFGRPQPPEIQRRIREETARAVAVSRRSLATPRLWEFPFQAPRAGRVTSGFGHGRMFNGQIQSRHTGTDFAGTVGAPVHATARGRVALVDDFYLAGRVIYLDHGAGLVTAYLHLSEQLVAEGDTVEAGQLIGTVGASGRVTGPHLHWIVRYGDHSVDGQSLLALPAPSAP